MIGTDIGTTAVKGGANGLLKKSNRAGFRGYGIDLLNDSVRI